MAPNSNLPTPRPFSLRYLRALTDDFGIWQHTAGKRIDRQHGYALDDSARALIVAAQCGEADLSRTYLSFITRAVQDPDRTVNFFDSQRRPRPLAMSEDALGQAYWALSVCVDRSIFPEEAAALAATLTDRIRQFHFLRGKAYALMGALSLDHSLAGELHETIAAAFRSAKVPDWPWSEDTVTYANAILPWSLFHSAATLSPSSVEMSGKTENELPGLKSLRFLNQVMKEKGVPSLIGNRGWFPRGQTPARYDQQPIEAAYLVLANCAAFSLTGQDQYLSEAKNFFSWFWGNNPLGIPLVDPEEEAVYDGLHPTGISPNRGAENIVCYLWAQHAIAPYLFSSGRR
jgi:hypothetical protein